MNIMIVRRMLFLFFALVGVVFSCCFSAFVLSKRFREYITVQVLKVTWPEKLGGGVSRNFFSVCDGDDYSAKTDLFAKMGAVLDSYNSFGNTPEINENLRQLQEMLKEYYQELKERNVPQKKLRSVAYQMQCIQTLLNADVCKKDYSKRDQGFVTS